MMINVDPQILRILVVVDLVGLTKNEEKYSEPSLIVQHSKYPDNQKQTRSSFLSCYLA